MAKVRSQTLRLLAPSNTIIASLVPYILLASGPYSVKAQLQHPPTDAAPTMAAPTLIPNHGDTLIAASSASASALPSSTDDAGYASNNNNRSSDTGVLNYYFLLLAVFIVVIIIVWWSIARRRRNKVMHLRNNQQSALARDLETWPGRRRGGGGRWRFGGADSRVEEGLDERGEAPPPYLKELDPVHHGSGTEMELQNQSRGEAKPPDYEEGSARR